MNLEEKIGQLIVPRLDFNDPKFDLALVEKLIKRYHIGNFIVFGGEIGQVVRSLNQLQSISKQPVHFSADLERGLGQQIRGATTFPYFMGLAEAARCETTQLITEAARITALEARAAGIHLNYSPVLDINSNRDNPIINIRSFGEEPETVIQNGLAYIVGLRDHGMLSAVKHFPGHGDTQVDSHEDLPVLPHSAARLDRIEFRPFKRAVEERIDALMVGHIAVPVLDDTGLPATMSKKIIDGMLRNKWGFKGLIVTDALMMKAVTDRYSEEEVITKAFEAGADQLLMPVEAERACSTLTTLVTNKPEMLVRLDQSVQRIMAAKQRLGLFENRWVDTVKTENIVGCREHLKFAESITQKCFTVKRGRWPPEIKGSNTEIWLIKTDRNSFSTIRSYGGLKVIESELSDENTSIPEFDPSKNLAVITDVKPMAWQKKNQLPETINQTLEKYFQSKEHLFVACGNPYIGEHLRYLKNFVCTYSASSMTQEEILKRLV